MLADHISPTSICFVYCCTMVFNLGTSACPCAGYSLIYLFFPFKFLHLYFFLWVPYCYPNLHFLNNDSNHNKTRFVYSFILCNKKRNSLTFHRVLYLCSFESKIHPSANKRLSFGELRGLKGTPIVRL